MLPARRQGSPRSMSAGPGRPRAHTGPRHRVPRMPRQAGSGPPESRPARAPGPPGEPAPRVGKACGEPVHRAGAPGEGGGGVLVRGNHPVVTQFRPQGVEHVHAPGGPRVDPGIHRHQPAAARQVPRPDGSGCAPGRDAPAPPGRHARFTSRPPWRREEKPCGRARMVQGEIALRRFSRRARARQLPPAPAGSGQERSRAQRQAGP